jgi:DsbC/DsbD-like thiol-disulfide interchange protein
MMRVKKILMSLLIISVITTSVFAQTSAKVVKIKLDQDGYKARKGTRLTGGVVIDIDEGYHINSSKPLDKFLIATALTMDPQPGIRLSGVVYPKAKMQKFGFSDKPLSVYEGRAIIKFTARVSPTVSPGNYTLKGKVRVQACNNEVCLRPQTVNIDIPVEILN